MLSDGCANRGLRPRSTPPESRVHAWLRIGTWPASETQSQIRRWNVTRSRLGKDRPEEHAVLNLAQSAVQILERWFLTHGTIMRHG